MGPAVYIIIGFYGVILTLLFIYGMNIFYLSYLTIKQRTPDPIPPPLEDFPLVTVQLPVYNEQYVARRVIEAVCQLDWPADKLEIQVLDDSTDHTVQIIESVVRQQQAAGVNIVHIQRENRNGYKAGALAYGLEKSHGEFIAIFDADFLPPSDFLQRTMPHFHVPERGFIQTRWGHLNADYSLLTRLQSIAIDAHFTIEQFARYQSGFLMNFNGTGGVWRRQAIVDAGGWRADTLTEDLDLSYRAQLAGWLAFYLRDVTTPGEIPVTLNSFRRQQHRWARGSIECARLLIPKVLRSNLTFRTKVEGLLHLTGYAIQFLMMLVVLLYLPLLMLVPVDPALNPFYALTILFTLTFFAPTVYLIIGQREMGRRWQKRFPLILGLSLLGTGMMYHNALAVLAGLFSRRQAAFERTPKFGITGKSERWQQRTAYKLKLSPVMLIEMIISLYLMVAIWTAYQQWNLSILFYATFFLIGLLFVIGMNLHQEYLRYRSHIQIHAQSESEPAPGLTSN